VPPIPVYGGEFGVRQAERLLWRAGFGPRPGDAEALAERGLRGAVLSLTRPEPERLEGPAPTVDGAPLDPDATWGHDHAWWLDRMIRSNRQLVERMTLNWHDWFATSRAGVDSGELMRKQNELLRRNALGSFRTLLTEITRDPAMLLWLSGAENTKWAPNENYAREMMELFTLGVNRGYRERDVREQARALTGFRNDWNETAGAHGFRYDREFHDSGRKRVFARAGAYNWRDSVRLCLRHRKHPSFVVGKLWSYVLPGAPDRATARELARLYVSRRYAIRPLVEALLQHPLFYEGPRMVKPPTVYIAGLLRATGQGIADLDWSWVSDLAGQMLFHPPNVAGWDESRWLDTATFRGRWLAANYVLRPSELDPDADETPYDAEETPETAVTKAVEFWGNPALTPATRAGLVRFATDADALADERWKRRSYPILRQNALRMLVATSPDLQTC
jgi:uncharacterized protein (DUF1800 family)